MRDPNRLDSIYNEIKELHKENFPDWRMMQLINNFLGWYCNKYKNDGFYMEDNNFINIFKEFVAGIITIKEGYPNT